MDRTTLAFAVATLFTAATATISDRAAAQSAPAAVPAAANPKLAGTWEGTFTTEGPSGAMTLTLKSGAPWTVANTLGGEAPPGGEPRDVAADGDKITWKQLFGEYDVTFTGTLGADGALSGTLEASQGGSVVAGGSFTLARKG